MHVQFEEDLYKVEYNEVKFIYSWSWSCSLTHFVPKLLRLTHKCIFATELFHLVFSSLPCSASHLLLCQHFIFNCAQKLKSQSIPSDTSCISHIPIRLNGELCGKWWVFVCSLIYSYYTQCIMRAFALIIILRNDFHTRLSNSSCLLEHYLYTLAYMFFSCFLDAKSKFRPKQMAGIY